MIVPSAQSYAVGDRVSSAGFRRKQGTVTEEATTAESGYVVVAWDDPERGTSIEFYQDIRPL